MTIAGCYGDSRPAPVLKSVTNKVNISKYDGQRVAVDAYCWLHKGAYCCSKELCEGGSVDRCVSFCMQRVALLQRSGVIPCLVFDGGRLPLKGLEEGARARSRQENLERARAHSAAGNTAAAYECYQKAVDITPETASSLIQALQKAEVEYLVAPYEADAQMAYLAIQGKVDAVLTEDSDLLTYGCPVVLFKMDKGGNCEEICMQDMSRNRDISFVGFTPQMFLEMCILAGCDFLKAIPGIGIRKAHAQIRSLKSFPRVCKSLRFGGNSVPQGYEQAFQKAIFTFHHQTVFCPDAMACVPLRPLPSGGLAAAAQVPMNPLPSMQADPIAGVTTSVEDEPYLGRILAPPIARDVAAGKLNPMTLQPFPAAPPAVLQPLTINCHDISKAARPKAAEGLKKLLPVQANGISHYFTAVPQSRGATNREFAAPRQKAAAALVTAKDTGFQEDVKQQAAQPTKRRRISKPFSAFCFQDPDSQPAGEETRDHLHSRSSCRAAVGLPNSAQPTSHLLHTVADATGIASSQAHQHADDAPDVWQDSAAYMLDAPSPIRTASSRPAAALDTAAYSDGSPELLSLSNVQRQQGDLLQGTHEMASPAFSLQPDSPLYDHAPLIPDQHRLFHPPPNDTCHRTAHGYESDADSLSLSDDLQLGAADIDMQLEQLPDHPAPSMPRSQDSHSGMALQALMHAGSRTLSGVCNSSSQPHAVHCSAPCSPMSSEDCSGLLGATDNDIGAADDDLISPAKPHPWAMLFSRQPSLRRSASAKPHAAAEAISYVADAAVSGRGARLLYKHRPMGRDTFQGGAAQRGTSMAGKEAGNAKGQCSQEVAASNSIFCPAQQQHADPGRARGNGANPHPPARGINDSSAGGDDCPLVHVPSHSGEQGQEGATVQGLDTALQSGGFHTTQHVNSFAEEATNALDRMQNGRRRINRALRQPIRQSAAGMDGSGASSGACHPSQDRPADNARTLLSKFACKANSRTH